MTILSFSMLLHLNTYNSLCYILILRIPLAAPSNWWFCGRSLVGIADSNLAGGECCVLLSRGLGTRPHPILCRPSVRMGLRGRWPYVFPIFLEGLLNWGLRRI